MPCVGYVRKREGDRVVHICVIKTVSMFKTSTFRLHRITGTNSLQPYFVYTELDSQHFFFTLSLPLMSEANSDSIKSYKTQGAWPQLCYHFVNNLREAVCSTMLLSSLPTPGPLQHLIHSKNLFSSIQLHSAEMYWPHMYQSILLWVGIQKW